MKRSRQVALVITGSVVLAACNQSNPASPATGAALGTNTVGGTNYTQGSGRVVSHTYYPWYHPYRYFSDSSGSGRSSSSSSLNQRSGSSSSSSTGSKSGGSSVSRGGFGHSSSSSS